MGTLRSRLTLLLATVLCVSTGLSLVAYLTGSREQNRLETAFEEELSFLAALPAQRARLRDIDLDADSYLLTREGDWLLRRERAIAGYRQRHAELGARLRRDNQVREWALVDRAFDEYISEQDAFLARARRGGLTRAETLKLTLAKDKVDALVGRVSRMGALSYQHLDEQRRAARRATLATFALLLLIGVLGAVAVAVAVSRIIVTPLQRLRDQAAGWALGRPWPHESAAPGEIAELQSAMRAMSIKLNEQFEHERQTSLLKSQLVSGVSHEFNNALAVIHAAHVLLKESERSDAAAPWHDMLSANIRALSGMATNLLNLGRLESGKFHVETSRVELGPLLTDALERLSILGRRKRLAMTLELAPDLPPVSADPDAVALVIANLLTNAFKYTHDGGAVALGAARGRTRRGVRARHRHRRGARGTREHLRRLLPHGTRQARGQGLRRGPGPVADDPGGTRRRFGARQRGGPRLTLLFLAAALRRGGARRGEKGTGGMTC